MPHVLAIVSKLRSSKHWSRDVLLGKAYKFAYHVEGSLNLKNQVRVISPWWKIEKKKIHWWKKKIFITYLISIWFFYQFTVGLVKIIPPSRFKCKKYRSPIGFNETLIYNISKPRKISKTLQWIMFYYGYL